MMIQHALDTATSSSGNWDTTHRGTKRKRAPPRTPPTEAVAVTSDMQASHTDMLLYNAVYRVVICRSCQYAIQPSALDSHLLRHKIYRAARRDLVGSVAGLPTRPPDEVELPTAGCRPIDGLCIVPGWRCSADDCGHLCASAKRLRHHWTHAHPRLTPARTPDGDGLGVRVHLQTFFRGTKLRYFEVSLDGAVRSEEPSTSQRHDETTSDDCDASLAGSGLDADAVQYFHHFVLRVAPSLADSAADAVSWQTSMIDTVLADPTRMPALLAVSAGHFALTSHSESEAEAHAIYSRSQSHRYLSARDASTTSGPAAADRQHALHQLVQWVVSYRWPPSTTPTSPNLPPLDISSVILHLRDIARSDRRPAETPSRGLEVDAHPALRLLPLKLAELYGRPKTFHEPWEIIRAIDSLSQCLAESERPPAATWCQEMMPGFTAMVSSGSEPALVVVAHWVALALRNTASQMSWLFFDLSDMIIERVLRSLSRDPGARALVTALLA